MVGGLTFDASRNTNCTRQRNILPPRHSQRGRLSLWSVRPGFLYTGRQAGIKPITISSRCRSIGGPESIIRVRQPVCTTDSIQRPNPSKRISCQLLHRLACSVWGNRSYRTLTLSIVVVCGSTQCSHRIPDTAVNTLEAYLHPRQLAFALGLVGVAIFLRGKTWLAVGAVAGAMLLHPTTAIWFAVLVGIAALVSDRESRQPILAIAGAGAAAAAVLLASTLREQIVVMNPSWTALLQTKDYLQATDWPMLTWFANLSFAAIVAAVYDYRRTLNLTTPRETGLVAGCTALLMLFLLSVPLAHSGVALIVQLQFSRIFWLLDIIAITYMVWLVIESPLNTTNKSSCLQVRYVGIALIFLAALSRGAYVSYFERSSHPLVEIDLPNTEWTAVMKWAEQKPIGTHFLVDPGHAWRYGSSVRVASGRDVYLEEIKDIGIAIYSDNIADRVSNRIIELGDFSQLDPSRAKRLARRYHIDYLITEHPIELPLVHEQGSFLVYDLRTDARFAQRTSAY